jgi:hypothetical protein
MFTNKCREDEQVQAIIAGLYVRCSVISRTDKQVQNVDFIHRRRKAGIRKYKRSPNMALGYLALLIIIMADGTCMQTSNRVVIMHV